MTDALKHLSIACCSSVTTVNFTHPIEVCKTRVQVSNNLNLTNIIRNEGIFSFWKGIKAAWLREATNTTVKLGMYSPIKKQLGADKKNSPFYLKFMSGSISGALGAITGNPFDVLKTLGMANSKENIPFTLLVRNIYRENGIQGFYRGLSANIGRAVVLNGTKMACYDESKTIVVNYTGWDKKNIKTQFISGIGAGFIMSLAVTPLDMLRTRIMNQPIDKQIYKNIGDAAIKIMRSEGPIAFTRGFLGIWGRAAPHSTLQLIIFDKLLNFSGLEI